jgi:hypothetical protein
MHVFERENRPKREKRVIRLEQSRVLTESGGGSDGHVMPGEAGGRPHDDHLLAAPPLPLLHQHPSRPQLPLYLSLGSADTGRVAAAAAASARLLLRRGGAPLEEPLGVHQLDHGCRTMN